MKILFKNKTQYTKENFNNFLEFHKNRYGIKMLIKLAILLICITYILIVNFLNQNWKIILTTIILILLIYILNQFRFKEQVDKNKKVIKSKKEFIFYFYEKYIKIKCGRKFERLIYWKIYKVYETEEYFFLYTDKDHSLILNRNGFEVGTPEEFSKFIKKKCLLKYKKEKNKDL